MNPKTQEIYSAELIDGKAVFELEMTGFKLDIDYAKDGHSYHVLRRGGIVVLIGQHVIDDYCPLKEGDKVTVEIQLVEKPLVYDIDFETKQATISNISIDSTKMKYRIECKL